MTLRSANKTKKNNQQVCWWELLFKLCNNIHKYRKGEMATVQISNIALGRPVNRLPLDVCRVPAKSLSEEAYHLLYTYVITIYVLRFS